ncbi:MAG: VOC family protein [Gammaproteobacteria bacterium]|nr:VOC family protein [Gammaproteobacteria bacterium]
MVKFGYTINYVADVDKALSFFEDTFEMKRRFLTEENDYGELETGETVLAFASHELGQTNIDCGYISATDSKQPLGTEIVLVSEDVYEIHENAINNGAEELNAPEKKSWGQTVSYLRCPSGILLELCTPMGQ